MKQMRVIVVAFLLAWPLAITAQEKISLTSPETYASNTTYRVSEVIQVLDDPATPADEGRLQLWLIGQNGESLRCEYNATTNPTATTLIAGLNKANLSTAYANNATTGSLKQRIAHRLVTMGESAQVCNKPLVGTLTGSVP